MSDYEYVPPDHPAIPYGPRGHRLERRAGNGGGAIMKNRAMTRKLDTGGAIDVETILELAAPDAGDLYRGTFRIDRFDAGADYCVGSTGQWVWSIGRRLSDGEIFAALDSRFYQNPDFKCLWLR